MICVICGKDVEGKDDVHQACAVAVKLSVERNDEYHRQRVEASNAAERQGQAAILVLRSRTLFTPDEICRKATGS